MRSLILFLIFSVASAVAAEGPHFPVTEARDNLPLRGISDDAETFTLSNVDASVVVLVVFDLYCPVCQKSAPNMKRLAESIQGLATEIPVLGFGSGDTIFETQKFKDKFKLPFPCISDREKAVSAYYHVERTPSIIVLERSGDKGELSETYRNEGYLGREHVEQVVNLLKTNK
ncbi:MAG: redoxin domain-containing protein [Verrucomicrobia bacterium]|nr:redoxin domain-containing protein [Verrucomicrobiota bacterium]